MFWGGLYKNSPKFDGVPDGWSNPSKKYKDNIPAWQLKYDHKNTEGYIMPCPDPNEDYADMKAQIDPGGKGTNLMKGFVEDYEKSLAEKNNKVTKEAVSEIMQYYSPYVDSTNIGYMPITTLLAKHYAISDQYHGSGPVQTWPNRLFAHCGTPCHNGDKAYLNNKEYPNYNARPSKWHPFRNPFQGQLHCKTVFNQLDDVNKSWKVYYNGSKPISGILNYVYEHWDTYSEGNVSYFEKTGTFNKFFQDVAQDKLPNYSFIEPRYQEIDINDGDLKIVPPNSNHPGGANVKPQNPPIPIDVRYGELMLQKIFNSLKNNPKVFKKTLLIVTYDENGGLFDHVKPKPAVSPFNVKINNYNYDTYGPRVPAIFINPYIKAGTVLRPGSKSLYPFDHTSIISTLRDQFELKKSLTPRVEAAPTFKGLIDTKNPLNMGPDNLPDMEKLLPASDNDRLVDLSEKNIQEEYGTVSYAIYMGVLSDWLKSKSFIGRLLYFIKRAFN